MLGNLQDKSVLGSLDLQGVENSWNFSSLKLDINNSTNDLGDLAVLGGCPFGAGPSRLGFSFLWLLLLGGLGGEPVGGPGECFAEQVANKHKNIMRCIISRYFIFI